MASRFRTWPPPRYDEILAHVGRIVFNFNSLEHATRRHLWSLATDGREDAKIEPAILHMGNVALVDAIKTTATEHYSGWIQEHSLYLCEVFDRTREYRNFYLHAFNTVTVDGNATLRSKSARGRMVEHELRITAPDVERVAKWCSAAASYGASVSVYTRQELCSVPHEKRVPFPDKPPLPDRLRKPRRYLQEP